MAGIHGQQCMVERAIHGGSHAQSKGAASGY